MRGNDERAGAEGAGSAGRVRYPGRRRAGHRRALLRPRAVAGPRSRGRIRLREVHDRARDHGAGAVPAGADRRRPHRVRGRGPRHRRRRADAEHPGQRDLDDLPGADDLAQSGVHGGGADRRGVADPSGALARGGVEAGRGTDRRGADPAPGPACRGVSAPAFRRHAPAHHDRDRARLPAEAADRGRTHHGAGRDRAGPDIRPAARPAGPGPAPR